MKPLLLAASVLFVTGASPWPAPGASLQESPALKPSPTGTAAAKRPLPKAMGISVAEFLRRSADLQQLKELARFSPDLPQFIAEFGEPITDYKKLLDADRDAGRPPRACPPRGTTQDFKSAQLIMELEKIPAAERGMPLRDAIYLYLDRRYPCTTPATATPERQPSKSLKEAP